MDAWGLWRSRHRRAEGSTQVVAQVAEVHLKAEEEPEDDAPAVDGVDQSVVDVLQP